MRPPLTINWISLCRSRSPCSTALRPHSHPRSLHDTTLTHRTTKNHEYCELFMIIRRLSIQSHDNLGAAVFKLMINSACCIQTQLIVFMPHAGARTQTTQGGHFRRLTRQRYTDCKCKVTYVPENYLVRAPTVAVSLLVYLLLQDRNAAAQHADSCHFTVAITFNAHATPPRPCPPTRGSARRLGGALIR